MVHFQNLFARTHSRIPLHTGNTAAATCSHKRNQDLFFPDLHITSIPTKLQQDLFFAWEKLYVLLFARRDLLLPEMCVSLSPTFPLWLTILEVFFFFFLEQWWHILAWLGIFLQFCVLICDWDFSLCFDMWLRFLSVFWYVIEISLCALTCDWDFSLCFDMWLRFQDKAQVLPTNLQAAPVESYSFSSHNARCDQNGKNLENFIQKGRMVTKPLDIKISLWCQDPFLPPHQKAFEKIHFSDHLTQKSRPDPNTWEVSVTNLSDPDHVTPSGGNFLEDNISAEN